MRATIWLRTGLLALTAVTATEAVWLLLFPHSFYTVVPTVDAYPPYNRHLFTDLGGQNLALAVLLGTATWLMGRVLVRAALATYLVASVAHLAFHATDVGTMSRAAAVTLAVALAVLVAVPIALLALTARDGVSDRPIRSGRRPGAGAPGAGISSSTLRS